MADYLQAYTDLFQYLTAQQVAEIVNALDRIEANDFDAVDFDVRRAVDAAATEMQVTYWYAEEKATYAQTRKGSKAR